ncbi:MAG: cysteine desulfurase NifS [Clostridia bacterium]
MKDIIYFDNAATTKLDDRAFNKMLPFLKDEYGNPSSIYSIANTAKSAIENARLQVANAIGANDTEVYFTSGGSESDNWAILGVANHYNKKGKHIISSKIEHHAVLHTLANLEKKGFEVTYLDVDSKGFISLDALKSAIREDTILISIMYANNEIGTIEPIREIGAIAKEHNIIFHTDAVQAVGNIPINVKDDNIDLMSISGHKLYGPRGVGALYIRKGIVLENLIFGGAQEKGKRAGTENTAAIVGFGEAIEIATKNIEENAAFIKKLRDKIYNGVISTIPNVIVNGDLEKRLPGNINFSVEFIEGESLLLMLDLNGICASSGSACTSGSLDPSHVLLALGLKHEIAHGSLRITLGHNNTEKEVDYFLNLLPEIVQRLRDMSPLYNKRKDD